MGQLQGKVAIITGAASGIGEAAVRLFVAEGAKVVMTDLQESGAAIAAELGSAAIFRVHDVTDEAGWPKIVDAALSHFGRLDVLFNNAAIRHVKPMMETTVADMERSFRINAIGPMLGMKAAYEALRASGKGSIINVSSGNAIRFQPGTVPYTTSKFAVRGVSGCAAAELGRVGIRVNILIPGMVATPMLASTNTPEILAHYEPMVPLGRIGEPIELAQAALFLASDASSYVNGTEFFVDGGAML
jgi:3alpha(or 20beta)-hydroxysteroid dehydrogenase